MANNKKETDINNPLDVDETIVIPANSAEMRFSMNPKYLYFLTVVCNLKQMSFPEFFQEEIEATIEAYWDDIRATLNLKGSIMPEHPRMRFSGK